MQNILGRQKSEDNLITIGKFTSCHNINILGKPKVIFIELYMKCDLLSNLKGNSSYKNYNLRIKSEICK